MEKLLFESSLFTCAARVRAMLCMLLLHRAADKISYKEIPRARRRRGLRLNGKHGNWIWGRKKEKIYLTRNCNTNRIEWRSLLCCFNCYLPKSRKTIKRLNTCSILPSFFFAGHQPHSMLSFFLLFFLFKVIFFSSLLLGSCCLSYPGRE